MAMMEKLYYYGVKSYQFISSNIAIMCKTILVAGLSVILITNNFYTTRVIVRVNPIFLKYVFSLWVQRYMNQLVISSGFSSCLQHIFFLCILNFFILFTIFIYFFLFFSIKNSMRNHHDFACLLTSYYIAAGTIY